MRQNAGGGAQAAPRRSGRANRDRTQDQRATGLGMEPSYGGGGGRGRGGANPTFTVQVPFDITPNMPCRAMYYGDESFYDAVTISKTHRGWLVGFVGFEGEPPQETEVADILSLPGKQNPNFQQQNMAPGLQTGAPPNAGRGRGRGQPQLPSPTQKQQRAPAQDTRPARRCRFGANCTIYACTFDHPEGRIIDGASWDACEALFYDEGTYYSAFRGPKTPSGYLVSFVGYELDPCQDTLEKDIRMTDKGGRARGKRDKVAEQEGKGQPRGEGNTASAKQGDGKQKPKQSQQQGDGQQGAAGQGGGKRSGDGQQGSQAGSGKKKGGAGRGGDAAPAKEEAASPHAAAAGAAEKEARAPPARVPNELVVLVKNLDASVTKQNLWTFCNKTVERAPSSIRMLKRSATKPDGTPVAENAPGRALLIFDSVQDVAEYMQRARGLRLKGKKLVFTLKSDSVPSGQPEPDGVGPRGGDDEFEEEGAEDGASKGVAAQAEDLSYGSELQMQMGKLYDALLGGSLLSDGSAGTETSEEVGLTFGISLMPSVTAAMHVLRHDGESVHVGSSGVGKMRVRDKSVALAVPTSWNFSELAKVKEELVAALPSLDPSRVTLLDVMTAAAVEFVDGWYSNIYETNTMQLVLVNLEGTSLQMGLVNVSPTTVDTVLMMSTFDCGEDSLLQEATTLLAEKVQEQVQRSYGFETDSWWPDGLGVLQEAARRMVSDVGSKGQCWMPMTYCPPGRDAAYMVDVRVSAAELQSGEGRACTGAAMMLAQQLMQAAARIDAENGIARRDGLANIAPVGTSVCGELLCRAMLPLVGASNDSLHMFLRDPRNLAAGAARAALWLAEEEAAATGGAQPSAGAGGVKKVVRRCHHPYGCAVVHTTDDKELGMIEIPWVCKGRELPVKCTVNDLEQSEHKFVVFVGGPRETRDILATMPLSDCDEVLITIGKDGLMDARRLCKQQPLSAQVELTPLKDKEEAAAAAEDGGEQETSKAVVFRVLRPIFEAT